MKSPNIYATIRKVDEEQRLVYGRIAEEVVDKSGEIMDYEKSKPYFKAWSAEVSEDTAGKSLGNVRAMHGKIAAGKLTDIAFDDDSKAIDVAAKIVDDTEWKKVLEGIYTGFSIGGSYVGEKVAEKVDNRDVMRYVAKPNEVSLVDRPCIPTAKFFEVQKADGSLEQVEFKTQEEVEKSYDVTGSEGDVEELAKVMSEGEINVRTVIDLVKGHIEKVEEREDVDEADKKRAESDYGDVEFADEKNKKYPIDTAEHIRAAWNYINKEKNAEKYDPEDVKKIKAKIVAAWKDKIDKEGPPSAKTEKLDAAVVSVLRKDMYGCSSLSNVIQALIQLKQSAQYEAFCEGDESDVPEKLAALIAAAGQVMKDLIDEVLEENENDDEAPAALVTLAERAGELGKFEGDALLTLVKAGARHSAEDKSRLQAIHDHSVDMGADCPGAEDEEAEKLAKGLGDIGVKLEKAVSDAIAPLQKVIEEQKSRIEKLEAQPAPARISLRAISKGEDVITEDKPQELKMIKDDQGQEHSAATLIKALHTTGGNPLAYRG